MTDPRAASSNGKTSDFDSDNPGSTPGAAAKPINLYAIHDRSETPGGTMILIAATGSEHAIEIIRAAGFDWTLGNTRTNRLWRNIDRRAGIVDVLGMHRHADIRHHNPGPGRSRSRFLRRQAEKAARDA